MSQQDAFDRIVASLNEAAFDDAGWLATSALIDEACRVHGNMLVHCEGEAPDDVEIFLARFCYRGGRRPEMERSYFIDYYPEDERVPRLRQLPDSRLVHVRSLYSEQETKTSRTYNEALPRSNTQNSLHVRMDGPNDSRIVWAIADPGRCGRVVDRADRVDRESPAPRPAIRARPAGAGGLQGSRNVARLAPREHLVGGHPPGPTGPDRRG